MPDNLKTGIRPQKYMRCCRMVGLTTLIFLWCCLNGHARSIDWQGQMLPSVSTTLYPSDFPSLTENSQISLLYPMFERIQGEELRQMKPQLAKLPLEEDIRMEIAYGMERKQLCADVSFCPYVKRHGKYYRLVSYEFGIESPTPLRSASSTILNDPSRYAAESVLAKGKWVKISVPESGIYRLSYDRIKKMGLNPANVQIYGYGGALLSEDFSQKYRDDLPVVPIYKDEANKQVLFYAQGTCQWEYNSKNRMYQRVLNHYSTKACYFVGEREGGSLLSEYEELSDNTSVTYETAHYTDFMLHESEDYNLGATGRDCFGEDFSSNSEQEFLFDAEGASTDEYSRIYVRFAANSPSTSRCQIYVNDQTVGTMNYAAISADNTYTLAKATETASDFVPDANGQIRVRIQYNANGATPKAAHLDHIVLNVRKKLQLNQDVLLFRDPQSIGNQKSRFILKGADASTLIFKCSQDGITRIPSQYSDGELRFETSTLSLEEFAAVRLNGKIPEPSVIGKVANQNLHGLDAQDFLIITHEDFYDLAEKLAEAHRNMDGLRVKVVTAEQIYNEFSSGTPDATAYRRFVKMFYDRADTEDDMPQSLLLFGDGVYDNRMITHTFRNSPSNPAKLLVFESKESLEATSSYVSDDYFGFLDDTEGTSHNTDRLDIGIGRFPVRTRAEAEIAVDKSINYMKNKDKGTWKNTLCFMSDDGDNNSHIQHADNLAQLVKNGHPEFMINKIYVDAFERVSTASGTTVPDANQRFNDLLSSGLLLLNYSGHGSTTTWATESLLTIRDIRSMQNNRLPLWVTATCDFCRYDDFESSGGELVFLNGNGGAIALITTTRVVYSGPNYTLNRELLSNLFSKQNGKRLTLGQVLCRTKQSNALKSDQNKLNFALIGDPALRLAYPELTARITGINGHGIREDFPDTIQAMSTVTMEGEILDSDGSAASGFDGIVYATVFDAENQARTLGNSGNDVFEYADRSQKLYCGKASVHNGRFSFSFIVPKDLSYSFEKGQINLYAYDSQNDIEAQGVFDGFVLGGTSESERTDSEGPEIQLYLNDRTFQNGGKVNQTPTLIAVLSDPDGLNTSGNRIGHDLSLIVDGGKTVTLNQYYESDMDNWTSGSVYYHLGKLEDGWHTLQLKAWDMLNNSSTATVRFEVNHKEQPTLDNLELWQDGQNAWFSFTHDRPEVWMDAELQIYDLMGRLQWKRALSIMNRDNNGESIEWDYDSLNGGKVPDGLYLCRLSIRIGDREQASISKKIMVRRQ